MAKVCGKDLNVGDMYLFYFNKPFNVKSWVSYLGVSGGQMFKEDTYNKSSAEVEALRAKYGDGKYVSMPYQTTLRNEPLYFYGLLLDSSNILLTFKNKDCSQIKVPTSYVGDVVDIKSDVYFNRFSDWVDLGGLAVEILSVKDALNTLKRKSNALLKLVTNTELIQSVNSMSYNDTELYLSKFSDSKWDRFDEILRAHGNSKIFKTVTAEDVRGLLVYARNRTYSFDNLASKITQPIDSGTSAYGSNPYRYMVGKPKVS